MRAARLGLAGYDAVACRDEGRTMKGRRELSATAQGALFPFSSEAHRRAFLAGPAPYLPAYGGWLGDTLKKWRRDGSALKARADAPWPGNPPSSAKAKTPEAQKQKAKAP